MGGIFFDHLGKSLLWRLPFPPDVQANLVSADHPVRMLTDSDLEHAGLLGQVSLMPTTHEVRYATLSNVYDNTPAVS